ncbi:MAG TPA: AAA family ATPase [Bryobacterales bacterium]|nr:AAA family ATPase [Bryobacterales bacterium]
MFSAVLFAPDPKAAEAMEQAARESADVCIYKTIEAFPAPYEMTRVLNSFRPDVVFVDLGPFDEAVRLARKIRVVYRDAGVVGVAQGTDKECEQQAREAGIREIVTVPVDQERLRLAVERAARKTRPPMQRNLLAFLPAKAGGGATTVAINLAGCLARDLEQKVLVIEADLRSGTLSVLLKLAPANSILDALKSAPVLDAALWSGMVVKAQGLDLLATSRPTEGTTISWTGYHHLLEFVKKRYDTVVVDLPEVINDATLEIVRRARKVFVVTTAELPALALARQRRRELESGGVPKERISVIMNRWVQDELQAEAVEKMLGLPIAASFPNDYQSVRRAVQQARVVGKKSELGQSFTAFAYQLAGRKAPEPEPKTALSFLDALLPKKVSAER